jgi:hypothetical protein
VKKKYRKLKELNEFVENYQTPQVQRNDAKNNILLNKEGVSNVTRDACIRPDIFLDNDRYCDDCPYYEHCGCNLKRLVSDKKRKN